jgi:hypothetical protein
VVEDATAHPALTITLQHGCQQGIEVSSLKSLAATHPSLHGLFRQIQTAITLPGDDLAAALSIYPNISSVRLLPTARDTHLETLSRHPRIRALNLRGCNGITAQGLQHLTALPNLETLNLCYCMTVFREAPAQLINLTALTHLDLGMWFELSDASLALISQLSQLKSLNLLECRMITDAGLAHLAALKNLERLSLRGCRAISDAGLVHLAQLPHLRELDLVWMEQISQAAQDRLQTALPSLKILTAHPYLGPFPA